MIEVPSPNVTVNIPLAFKRMNDIINHDSGFHWNHEVRVHLGGKVLVFEPTVREIGNIVSNAFDEAFDEYVEHLYPVGVTGLKTEGKPGSMRFCTMSAILSDVFDHIISYSEMLPAFPGTKMPYIGVSKYFRAMKYSKGGEHYPHYDSDYSLPLMPGCHTKMSLVCFGDTCDSGDLAFVKDSRKNHGGSDWDRQASEDEIVLRITPKRGMFVLFDHALCHTVLPFDGRQRRILRGDVIFKEPKQ